MGEKLICENCEHFFDGADQRAHVSASFPPLCPACAMEQLRGSEAWSVWNDCQGIWGDGVGWSRADAEAHLASGRYDGADCRVVPVRIYPEREDRIDMREWQERQRMKATG